MGNTCFLNAAVQCLSYAPALVNYLTSGVHRCALPPPLLVQLVLLMVLLLPPLLLPPPLTISFSARTVT